MGVKKYLGRDVELSTTGIAPDGRGIDAWEVTQAVLRQIPAVFAPRPVWTPRARWSSHGSSWSSHGYGYGSHESGGGQGASWSAGSYSSGSHSPGSYSTDELRHWPPNGQCYYADLSHVEACSAETLDPLVFAAQSLSLLVVAEEARRRAEALAPAGTRYCLSAAGVDLQDPDIAWGAHLNVSISTELWEGLFLEIQQPSRLGFVASALAAAIVFFGGGYVPPRTDRVVYSLSARAHHLTRVSTLTTTTAYARGILNSRREPHAAGQERLHLIGFDLALAGAALLATFVQCALLAAEEGFSGLALRAPVDALQSWSRGLDLVSGRVSSVVARADGGRVTLARYVGELAELFQEMRAAGLIRATDAPRADEHLAKIRELARYLEEGSLARCARHLDWAAKIQALAAVCEREGLALDSAPLRILDHDFGSSDPGRGLFWQRWAAGELDPLVTPEAVEACLVDGPEDSRAWTRGRLIQNCAGRIHELDWSRIELASAAARLDPSRLEPSRIDPSRFDPSRFDPSRFDPGRVITMSEPGSFSRQAAEGWLTEAEQLCPERPLNNHGGQPEHGEEHGETSAS